VQSTGDFHDQIVILLLGIAEQIFDNSTPFDPIDNVFNDNTDFEIRVFCSFCSVVNSFLLGFWRLRIPISEFNRTYARTILIAGDLRCCRKRNFADSLSDAITEGLGWSENFALSVVRCLMLQDPPPPIASILVASHALPQPKQPHSQGPSPVPVKTNGSFRVGRQQCSIKWLAPLGPVIRQTGPAEAKVLRPEP
jgi:hypothetical protein